MKHAAMKQTAMKQTAEHALIGLAMALGAFGAAGCVASNPAATNHWAFESVEGSIRQHVFGHTSSDENALRDAYRADAQNVVETLGRHFMHQNRDNPFHGEYEGLGLFRESHEYELPAGGFQPTGR
jgi:hypothetical protein